MDQQMTRGVSHPAIRDISVKKSLFAAGIGGVLKQGNMFMLRVKAVLVCYAQVNSRVWETHPNPRHGGRNPVLGQGLKSTDGDVGSGLDLHRLFCCAGYRCQRSRDHRCPVDTGSHRSEGRLPGSRIARAPVINRGRFCKISISGPKCRPSACQGNRRGGKGCPSASFGRNPCLT